MASTTYRRLAEEWAFKAADMLSEMTGHTYVVEGSPIYTKYLRIVKTDDGSWMTVTEFFGGTWSDVFTAAKATCLTLEHVKED